MPDIPPDILPELTAVPDNWYAPEPGESENLKEFLASQDMPVSLKYVSQNELILEGGAVDAQNIWGRLLTYFRSKGEQGFFAGLSAAEDMYVSGGVLTVRVPERQLNYFRENAERVTAALKELNIPVSAEFIGLKDGKEQEKAELDKIRRMLGGLPLNIIK